LLLRHISRIIRGPLVVATMAFRLPWAAQCAATGRSLFPNRFDPFVSLGLPRSAALPSRIKLKEAFRRAAVRWHPDRCRELSKQTCEAKMQQINLAREVLSDARRLQMWDAWHRAEERAAKDQNNGKGKQAPRRRTRHNSFPQNQSPPPSPAPSPPQRPPQSSSQRPPQSMGVWREVSRYRVHGVRGAEVDSITRERSVLGTPMVQVEVLEQTCYKAQTQCQMKVLERRRRKREDGEANDDGSAEQAGPYRLRQDHCHMGTSEEVLPAGPPPSGNSFFQDIRAVEGCMAKCDAIGSCVAFQLKHGLACWIYRFRPHETNTASVSEGWTCGVRG